MSNAANIPAHAHAATCRAVNFDDTGAYTGTCASDPENCGTCKAEVEASA